MVRIVQLNAAEICKISYILNSVTFEETPVTVEEMRERIQSTYSKLPWIIILEFRVVEGIPNNLAAPFEPDIFQWVLSKALTMFFF